MKVFMCLAFVSMVFFSCGNKEASNKEQQITLSNGAGELIKIRDNFKQINSIRNWTVIDSIDLYETAEGGLATFYYADKQLKKITAIYYGTFSRSHMEFYLKDGKLSFVFEKKQKYSRSLDWKPIAADDKEMDLSNAGITEIHSYFYKDILFEQVQISAENREVFNENLEKEQMRIKEQFKVLKQQSLSRQI